MRGGMTIFAGMLFAAVALAQPTEASCYRVRGMAANNCTIYILENRPYDCLPISVNILSTDTAEDVCHKIAVALDAAGCCGDGVWRPDVACLLVDGWYCKCPTDACVLDWYFYFPGCGGTLEIEPVYGDCE